MLEQLKEWVTDPRVIAFVSIFVGCYILRDVVRVFLYIFDTSRRKFRKPRSQDPLR